MRCEIAVQRATCIYQVLVQSQLSSAFVDSYPDPYDWDALASILKECASN